MPPKSKKPIDEPPAHSTRAKTDGASDGNSKSRKRATDFFDGEIGENSETVVPRSKVPKAKTAKQTAEVEANSKPIHIDHTYDEAEETRAVGDSGEAEPTAHAKSHAKTSKARVTKGDTTKSGDAGDSTATHIDHTHDESEETRAGGDTGEAEPTAHAKSHAKTVKPKKNKATIGEAAKSGDVGDSTEHAKPKRNKATIGEAAGSGKADDSIKPTKSKKGKATKGEAAKPSKVDAHPMETDKATTGEAAESGKVDNSTTPTKSKKGKATKGEAAKPSKLDAHPIETEKTHPGGDLVEVEPAERAQGKKAKAAKNADTEAVPAESTKAKGNRGRPKQTDDKANAASAQDDQVDIEAAERPKSRKGKAAKGVDAEAAPVESIKATKGNRGRPKKADNAANASVSHDEHVETESTERAQGKKGEAAKNASDKAAPLESTKAKGSRGRPKKADNKANATSAHDDDVETEKIHPGGDRVVVEPIEPAKAKKGKTTEGSAAGEPPAQSSKPKGKSKGSKTDETIADTLNPQDHAAQPSNKAKEPASAEKKTTKTAESKSSKKTAAGKDKPAKSEEKSGSAKQAASTEPQKKAERTKAPSAKAKSNANAAEIESDMAMDDSVFDSLLSTTDKGKQPVVEGPVSIEKSKPAKASKKASNDQTMVDTSAKATAKPEKKAKDAPEAPTSESKKRKNPADLDADAVKKDVLDPLADLASAKKKQKKSQQASLGAVGSLLGSTIDSAKKKAKAVIDYAGDITGSAQKSIMDDVTGVAEGVVEEEEKKKKRRSKGDENSSEEHSEDAKAQEDGNASADDDDNASFFGDTEFLKGFESSGDERDGEDVDFPSDNAVPALDKEKQAKARTALERAASSSNNNPGYIYVGRVPHGFYESQMRAYFSQFGHITNLRLSRNKNTGRSKHFAFLEFQSEEVAKIVAQTMDSYLLFGHILKVQFIPKEQLHPDTFKGANRRFTAVPWAKIQGRELAMPVGREHWEKRVEKEKEKREKKAEKAKEIGYEFDAPLKGVETVPVKKGKGKDTIEDASVEEEERTLITHEEEGDRSLIITETTKVKVSKGKGKEVETSAMTIAKKGKRKVEEAQDTVTGAAESLSEPAAKKMRSGKDKAVDSVAKGKEGVSKEAATVAKKTAEKARKAMK